MFAGAVLQPNSESLSNLIRSAIPDNHHSIIYQWAGKKGAALHLQNDTLLACPTNPEVAFQPTGRDQPSITPVSVFFMTPKQYHFRELLEQKSKLGRHSRDYRAQLDENSAKQEIFTQALKAYRSGGTQEEADAHLRIMQLAFPDFDKKGIEMAITHQPGTPDEIYNGLLSQVPSKTERQSTPETEGAAKRSEHIEIDWLALETKVFTFEKPENCRLGDDITTWSFYHKGSKSWRPQEGAVSEILSENLVQSEAAHTWIRSGKPADRQVRQFGKLDTPQDVVVSAIIDGAEQETVQRAHYYQYNPVSHSNRPMRCASITAGNPDYLLAYLAREAPSLSPKIITNEVLSLIRESDSIDTLTAAQWGQCIGHLRDLNTKNETPPKECTDVMNDALQDCLLSEEIDLRNPHQTFSIAETYKGEMQTSRYGANRHIIDTSKTITEPQLFLPSSQGQIVKKYFHTKNNGSVRHLQASPFTRRAIKGFIEIPHGPLPVGTKKHVALENLLRAITEDENIPQTMPQRLQYKMTKAFDENASTLYDRLKSDFIHQIQHARAEIPLREINRVFDLCIHQWHAPQLNSVGSALSSEDRKADFIEHIKAEASVLAACYTASDDDNTEDEVSQEALGPNRLPFLFAQDKPSSHDDLRTRVREAAIRRYNATRAQQQAATPQIAEDTSAAGGAPATPDDQRTQVREAALRRRQATRVQRRVAPPDAVEEAPATGGAPARPQAELSTAQLIQMTRERQQQLISRSNQGTATELRRQARVQEQPRRTEAATALTTSTTGGTPTRLLQQQQEPQGQARRTRASTQTASSTHLSQQAGQGVNDNRSLLTNGAFALALEYADRAKNTKTNCIAGSISASAIGITCIVMPFIKTLNLSSDAGMALYSIGAVLLALGLVMAIVGFTETARLKQKENTFAAHARTLQDGRSSNIYFIGTNHKASIDGETPKDSYLERTRANQEAGLTY